MAEGDQDRLPVKGEPVAMVGHHVYDNEAPNAMLPLVITGGSYMMLLCF